MVVAFPMQRLRFFFKSDLRLRVESLPTNLRLKDGGPVEEPLHIVDFAEDAGSYREKHGGFRLVGSDCCLHELD